MRKLSYATIVTEVVTVRYKAPASYQSRPAHPPSPAAVKSALARAAAYIDGEDAWRSILRGVLWCTYGVGKPLSKATYLISRLLPPVQRELTLRFKLNKDRDEFNKALERIKELGITYRTRRKGGTVVITVLSSADPLRGNLFKKPSNVFSVGEFIGGSLNIAVIYDSGTVSDDLIIKSLLGMNILGDNDSIVTPLPTTLTTGELTVSKSLNNDQSLSTEFTFRLLDAVPVNGYWVYAELPTEVRPRSYCGVKRVTRGGFHRVVIPARVLGEALLPAKVYVKVGRGVTATIRVRGRDESIILPEEVVGDLG